MAPDAAAQPPAVNCMELCMGQKGQGSGQKRAAQLHLHEVISPPPLSSPALRQGLKILLTESVRLQSHAASQMGARAIPGAVAIDLALPSG